MSFSKLWAKKKDNNGILKWLPLDMHLEDTKNVIGRLWNYWLSDGQRREIAKSMNCSEDESYDVVSFIGAVHDIGKATPAFQTQKGFANSLDLDQILLEKLELEGFQGIKEILLTDRNKSHHTVAGEAILDNLGVKKDIGSIVGAHHGKPVDEVNNYECQEKAYTANLYQNENQNSILYKKWKDVQKEILDWALVSTGVGSVNGLPEIAQPGQVIISGLLIMADWIASNEHFFPLLDIDKESVVSDSKLVEDRLDMGWGKWYKNFPWEPDCFLDADEAYQDLYGFYPRDFQKRIFKEISEKKDIGIVIVESPMGGGKTEVALTTAIQLAKQSGRSGVFFGLPTQATSNGIFPRIEKWVEKLSKNMGENLSLHLSHGKASLNEKYQELPRIFPKDIDIDGKSSVYVNEWFSGKKTAMLDDFVVGTVDHFLMMSLKQKHLMLRHLGFSKKVVIIDEVHAYDAYMGQYLYEAIRWLGAYKVPLVILSATLPKSRRINLIKEYLGGRGVKKKEIHHLDNLQTEAYPILSYTSGNEVQVFDHFEREKLKKIEIQSLEDEELYDKIASLVENGGVIGIIVNTVGRAQKIAQECIKKFGEDMVSILHSNFIDAARIEKEAKLMQMIGKGAKRPNQKIVVGTQVIEQSLDINFDVLISDLCPIDLLIQRLGRLHRHKIERPRDHKKPVLYLLGRSETFDFNSGSSAVYGDYLLARSQYYLDCLGSSILLPEDISLLVQKVYGDEDILLKGECKEKYQEAKDNHQSCLKKKERMAKSFRLANPELEIDANDEDCTLIGWLNRNVRDDSEEAGNAQVRDIQATIEVVALKKVGNGYGIFGHNGDISENIPKFAMEITRQTIRLGNSIVLKEGENSLIQFLEDYNRKHLSNWQDLPWLKGMLGIIFDENQEFQLPKTKIRYDEKYGLVQKKESEDE